MTSSLRPDLAIIEQWIPQAVRVLDLGCGEGSLLASLQARGVRGYGVEISPEKIIACTSRQVSVIHADLEQGLAMFEDNSFDIVVLSQTLQAVRNTANVLAEMLRIGKEGMVTFPNFGYWQCRWQILCGRMPVSDSLPHQWHDTPNIHLCTTRDFEDLIQAVGGRVVDRCLLDQERIVRFWPDLRGSLAVYRFCRQP